MTALVTALTMWLLAHAFLALIRVYALYREDVRESERLGQDKMQWLAERQERREQRQ